MSAASCCVARLGGMALMYSDGAWRGRRTFDWHRGFGEFFCRRPGDRADNGVLKVALACI